MKKSFILLVFILILAGLVIFLVTYSSFSPNIPENNRVNENELILSNYQYIYDSMVSHICPGTTESFRFMIDGNEIIIIAQEKMFNEGLGQDISDYPDCISRGALINFYDSSIGLPEGLFADCVISETRPSDVNYPEYIDAKCNSRILFEILNSDRVGTCVNEGNCTLINSVDVNFRV